jgi:hypothetical protein
MKNREPEKPFTEEDLPSEPVCYTCPYYGESDSGEDTCRRWAPHPRVLFVHEENDAKGKPSGEPLTHIPKMCAIDVCGEHPLMPEYIERLRKAGVLKLGSAIDIDSADAKRYAGWRNRQMETSWGLRPRAGSEMETMRKQREDA